MDPLASIMVHRDDLRRVQTRLPRYWMGRTILLLEVLFVLVAVSWFEDRSLTARAIRDTGEAGWILVLLTAAGCFVGLADVIVNDLMPARFELPTAKHWRHVGLGSIGLALAVLAFAVVFTHGFSWMAVAYWLNAGIALALMLLDVFARLRGGV